MIRLAKREANKSTFRQRLGAVICKGGRPLSFGHNETGRYNPISKEDYRKDSIHAEEKAILRLLKAGRLHDLVGASLYVSRLMKNGTCGLAAPCKRCEALARSVGIKDVFYTTENGETMRMKL